MPYWRIQLCTLPWLNFWYTGLLTIHGVRFICELFLVCRTSAFVGFMSLHVWQGLFHDPFKFLLKGNWERASSY